MKGKAVSEVILILLFMGMSFSAVVSAETSVGVKAGDWMEYNIDYLVYTRSPGPPSPHETGIKLEVLGVQGTSVTLNLTTKFSDGTQTIETATMNIEIESAHVDVVIIPANLTVGDTFYSGSEDIGNITINRVEERTCAGERRSVVHATFTYDCCPFPDSYWDKRTGVLVEANLYESDYALTIKADKTNMWQTKIFGLDPVVFYSLFIVVIAIVATVVFFIVRRRKTSPETDA